MALEEIHYCKFFEIFIISINCGFINESGLDVAYYLM